MNIAALLTGKGTSSLPNKNIRTVRGRPIVYYPALAASRAATIQRFYASSDSDAILSVAQELGFTPIRRPDDLCRPESRHVDAIRHALGVISETDGFRPDILVVLLANTVTVKTSWIDAAIARIVSDPTISAVVPVFRDQDHHPYRAKRLDQGGNLVPFFDFSGRDISSNRQELPACFYLCHNFWALHLPLCLDNDEGYPPWSFMGRRVMPLEVAECFDIHDPDDFQRCEHWLETNDCTS